MADGGELTAVEAARVRELLEQLGRDDSLGNGNGNGLLHGGWA